jgi:hypothetical protein
VRKLAKRMSLSPIVIASVLAGGCVIGIEDLADDEDLLLEGKARKDLKSNSDPSRILVYSNNVENMIFDWKDLIHYMASRPERPDIFLVQQAVNAERLDEMLSVMQSTLGVAYGGRIAQASPTHTRLNDDVTPKPASTTAIIFRKARFDVLAVERWQPWGVGSETAGTADCSVRQDNSGYEVLKLRLRDVIAEKNLDVVSLRLWTANDCAEKNVPDIVGHLSAPLQIVGGDFNETGAKADGGYACWYKSAVAGLPACDGDTKFRFADPMRDFCTTAACVQNQYGIDYIFGRRGDGSPVGTSGFSRVGKAEADAADPGEDNRSNTAASSGFNDVTSEYSTHPAHHAYFSY